MGGEIGHLLHNVAQNGTSLTSLVSRIELNFASRPVTNENMKIAYYNIARKYGDKSREIFIKY